MHRCVLLFLIAAAEAHPPLLRLRGGVWEVGLHSHRARDLEAPLPVSGLPKTSAIVTSTDSSSKLRMYLKCFAIVLAWVGTGTVFYSRHNGWPLAQSFFYAVDAGMSIGFCTDVRERLVSSRAFTIVFILLGASCVGGALALFVEDAMEGVLAASTLGYKQLLEQQAFLRADGNHDGALSYEEFRALVGWSGYMPSGAAFQRLCRHFDRSGDGVISYGEFKRSFGQLDRLLRHSRRVDISGEVDSKSRVLRAVREELLALGSWARQRREHLCFCGWMAMGVTWGVRKQGWDIITACHFAVSALATGGLTAPPVNAQGILPADDAIFVGVYCLFGIPLFALTLSKLARVLVESHVVDAERKAIAAPMHPEEFELAKSLCTDDGVVHLSDFVVLHLLRQGKLDIDTIRLLRAQFELLDVDASGMLTLEEATRAQQPSSAATSAVHRHGSREQS